MAADDAERWWRERFGNASGVEKMMALLEELAEYPHLGAPPRR